MQNGYTAAVKKMEKYLYYLMQVDFLEILLSEKGKV